MEAAGPIIDYAPNTLEQELAECRRIITEAYESAVMMSDAELHAARFLGMQMLVADELAKADLDSRMRKNGVKALKAAIWFDAATKDEKKPSDKQLDATVDKDPKVQDEQRAYDGADARREALYNWLGILKDGHIFFRGIAKGKYE